MLMRCLTLASAMALAGCNGAQVGSLLPTSLATVASVARSIDAGVVMTAAELPIACRLTADLADAAKTLDRSGRHPRLNGAANAALAVVGSELCRNPSTNVVSASVEIIAAFAAAKEAYGSGFTLSAAKVANTSSSLKD